MNIEIRKASKYSGIDYIALAAEKRIALQRAGRGWSATILAPHWQRGVVAEGITRQLATQAAIVKAERYSYTSPA